MLKLTRLERLFKDGWFSVFYNKRHQEELRSIYKKDIFSSENIILQGRGFL